MSQITPAVPCIPSACLQQFCSVHNFSVWCRFAQANASRTTMQQVVYHFFSLFMTCVRSNAVPTMWSAPARSATPLLVDANCSLQCEIIMADSGSASGPNSTLILIGGLVGGVVLAILICAVVLQKSRKVINDEAHVLNCGRPHPLSTLQLMKILFF